MFSCGSIYFLAQIADTRACPMLSCTPPLYRSTQQQVCIKLQRSISFLCFIFTDGFAMRERCGVVLRSSSPQG
jgi:hypothetical protein